MSDFFRWLSSNTVAATTLIVFLSVVLTSTVLMYLVAFFQGRKISFWPPRIGAKPVQAVDFLTVDPRQLLGAKRAIAQLPHGPDKTVDARLDEVYYSQEPLIPPHTYRVEWVLRDAKTGRVFGDIGRRWAEGHGLPRDNRTLKEVGITPGMRLEIILPEGRSKKKRVPGALYHVEEEQIE